MKPVELSAGGSAIVVYVPRSWNAPHRIVAKSYNRFFVRNSNGIHEASVDELRGLFLGGAQIEESARAFRGDRVNRISVNQGQRATVGNGRLIVHLIPLTTLAQRHFASIEDLYKQHESFWPIGRVGGMTPIINIDGVLNYRGGAQCHGYTQLFRNGVVEATRSSVLQQLESGLALPIATIEAAIESIEQYLNGIKKLNVPTPILIAVTLQGVANSRPIPPNKVFDIDEITLFRESDVYLPEIVLTEYGDRATLHKTLRPIFDALWNAAGHYSSSSFTDEGIWQGTTR